MILTLFLNREEFAARRRKAQDDALALIRTDVAASIADHQITDDLTAQMFAIFADAYHQETGEEVTRLPASVAPRVKSLIDKSNTESNVDATALAIVTILLNEATIAAAQADEDELFLEWVTMHDGAVRQAHKDTDGQVRPIGEKFDVDGVSMSMPGDVTAPIEFWINCRCTLRPTFPQEAQSTETEPFSEVLRDVSKDERDRRSKDGTALPDGSYPIANCEDLRNAIQAIGRAKDPAKAKAHIKKRKSALGCPDVSIPDSWSASVTPFGSYVVHTGPGWNTAPPWYTVTNTNPWQTYTTSTSGVITMTTAPEKAPEVTPAEDDLATLGDMDEEQVSALEMLVPWHGVLAPEGVASGDGRTFAPDSLTNRDLPLPLTYQKSTAGGHDGSVVVGSIESIERQDGLMLGSGWMLSTPEADELIGLMAHFGKYGVSVDADNAEFDYDEDSNAVTFTAARICSASAVSIPAFSEAYIALGPWEEDPALTADAGTFKDLAPGKTEDGPGWLTHPVDTERLRRYWVHGPGAAKIDWGVPGDFNRCRLELAKYIKPQYLSGYCANRHYDALGFWPGRPTSGEVETFTPAEGAEQAPALSLVASATEPIKAPADWFTDPGLTERTHFTVTPEGQVFGHIAEWGVCHIGLQGMCVEPPKSATGYSSFANKFVLLDNDEFARTGVITLGGKHAPGVMGLRSASRHYDDTTRGVADVVVGEDQFGIWVAGWVRPGTSEEDVVTLRASDMSGDWRSLDGWSEASELVGVLAVNTGGFPVRVAASGERVLSLVAAGMIEAQSTEPVTETDKFAEAIVKAMELAEKRKKARAERMLALRGKFQTEED